MLSAIRPWHSWLLALLAGPLALVWLLRAGAPSPCAAVAVDAAGEPASIVIVFVDSLSDRVARDPRVMPNLAALAARGVALTVEPCRDRLTYLCLRAALTGRDESSLLSFHRNFDHDLPSGETLLHQVAGAGGRVVAAGAHDLAPYRAALADYAPFGSADEPELAAVSSWQRMISSSPARVAVLGFSEGDRAAHAHGAGGPAYDEAFGRIDQAIGEIAARLPPSSNLLVFGDHGHDARGRHLPGGEATTFAVYAGPAFSPGVEAQARITDHRAILGVLLGVPTPATYEGPRLEGLLRPAWLSAHFAGGLPQVRGRPAPTMAPGERAVFAAAVALLAWLGLRAAGLFLAERRRAWRSLGTPLDPLVGSGRGSGAAGACAAAMVALIALEGHGYHDVRRVIHDQGYNPGRWLYLLFPLGSGFAIALALSRARRRGDEAAAGAAGWPRASWVLLAGAPLSVLGTLLCLFPSANYYGAGRAVVHASFLGLAATAAGAWLLRGRRPEEHRPAAPSGAAWLGLGCALSALALFYDVSGRGGASGEMVHYVMRAAAFEGTAWAPLIAAKVALYLLLRSALRPSSLDRALGAGLLATALLVQLAGLPLPRPACAALLIASAGPWPSGRRLPLTRTCAALLLLNHFFPSQPIHQAPIEVLLAGTTGALVALGSAPLSSSARALARGVTLIVAWYLMLWPTVGMRLSGIDFAFMFGWVPVARYDELWWLIALGMALKFAWPYLLLMRLAEHAGVLAPERRILRAGLAAKTLCLSLFASAYGITHAISTNLAQETLTELALAVAITLLAGLLAATTGLARRFIGRAGAAGPAA